MLGLRRLRSLALASLALLAAASASSGAHAAVISSIYPSSGGLLGGQVLTITGSGFHRGGTQGTTNAYVGNNLCKQIEYYSTDNQYVCVTPPAAAGLEGSYSVQIVVEGVGVAGFASSAPLFTYSAAYTSSVWQFPAAAGAGALLPFSGSFVDSSMFAQWQIKMGTTWCDMDFAGLPEYADVYGSAAVQARGYLTTQNNEPMWTNSFQCFPLAQTAGRVNLSVTILPPQAPESAQWNGQHGGGYSVLPHSQLRTSLDSKDEVYSFEALPVVSKLSSVSGGTQGGSPLTLSGSGFDAECRETSVQLAGQPCKITRCTEEEIVCVPSAATTVADPVLAANRGSRGLTARWTQTFVSSASLATMFASFTPTFTAIQAASFSAPPGISTNQWYMLEESGLFTPPFTASYSFYANVGDKAELSLSSDESAANLAVIASTTGTPLSYFGTPSQISASVPLVAGQSYAIRLRAVHNGGQSVQPSIMLRMDRSTVSPADLPVGYPSENVLKYHSLPTVMQIAVRTDVRRETQQIAFAGIAAGRFRVQYSTKLTDYMGFENVTASVLDAAITSILRDAGVCSDISVGLVRTPLNSTAVVTVQFNCPGAGVRALLNVVNDGLTEDSSNGVAFNILTTRTQTPSVPASGSFQLAWSATGEALTTPLFNMDHEYSVAIPFDASATRMQQALLSIAGVRSVSVSNGGNVQDGQTFTVTIYTPYGSIPAIQALYNTTLLGENARVEITQLQAGDSSNHYWNPLPAEFLSQAAPASRIDVQVHGIRSVCSAVAGESYAVNAGDSQVDCTYSYSAAITPTITAILPAVSTLTPGATITVQGTNFDVSGIDGSNLISFARDAPVLAADFAALPACLNIVTVSATELTCVVPELQAGAFFVQVNVAGRGLNAANALSALNFALRLDSVSPSSGSQAGGTLLLLSGSGFQTAGSASPDSVTVNGLACAIVDMTSTAVICRTPALPAGDATPTAPKAIELNAGAVAVAATFTYDVALTPTISTLSETTVSTAVTNVLTITGSGFVSNMALAPAPLFAGDATPIFEEFSVNFGDRNCAVMTFTPTQIVCRLVRAPPPNLHAPLNERAPTLYVGGLGYASNPSALKLDIALRVHSLSASSGSLAGGLVLTIAGQGFKPQFRLVTDHSTAINPEYISVRMTVYANATGQPASPAGPFLAAEKTFPCAVLSHSMTEVVCRVTSTNVTAAELGGAGSSLLSRVVVSVNNVQSVCGSATDAACEYSFRADDTSAITAISPTEGVAGDVLTITGSGLLRSSASVFIGHEPCAILTNTSTQITCTVPAFTASTMPVYVHFAGVGFAEAPRSQLRYSFLLSVGSASITTGSVAGGASVILSGNGFSPRAQDNLVTFGAGVAAYVVNASTTQLVVLTPPASASAVTAAGGSLSASISVQTTSYYALKDFFAADIVLANVDTGIYTAATFNAPAGSFVYAQALTAALTSVSPSTGVAGAVLTVVGSGFTTTQGSVVLGGVACVVSAWSDVEITCTLGETPAGQHAVLVSVGTNGYAATSTSTPLLFTSTLSVSSISPLSGGYGGGTVVTVQGAGFSSVESESTITVGNTPCLVQSGASYSQLTCVTTPLVTLDRLRAFGATMLFPATGVASGTNKAALGDYATAFDGNVETPFLGLSSGQTSVRLDTGALSSWALTRVRFYASYQQAQTLIGSVISVSDDGATWTAIKTVSACQEGWNNIDIVETNSASVNVTRSYRHFQMSQWGPLKIQEVEFQGYRVAAGINTVSNPAVDAVSVPVQVQVTTIPAANPAGSDIASPALVFASQFAYSILATPTVSAIFPTYASALGGEEVTITGTGFVDGQLAQHAVKLNDYDCAVTAVTATEIKCTTGARIEARPSPTGREISVQVMPSAAGVPSGFALLTPTPVPGNPALLNEPQIPIFRYLDKWSALTTWRFQEPPMAGDTVVIPQGQAVILDVSPPELFVLLIQGVLIFDEKDLSLDASYIYVQGGLLQIGTEAAPFQHKATITLHGDRWKSIELPHFGSKVLVNGPISYAMKDGVGAVPVNPMAKFGKGVIPSALPSFYSDNWDGRGRLDLHGTPRIRTWTKVSTSALAGSSVLVTSEDVDFAVGEEVVITSHRAWYETERRFVAGLAGDKRTLTLSAPLTFDHVSEQWTIEGEAVDMRYEVGLLTRNIVVQGDSASDAQLYGGHIMSLRGGIMRVENIEIRKMGQSHNLGRYSIHFHLADQVHESYVRSNSIHDAFQRACTVHGSHYARVQNNVAAFVKGHTYFVEDGNERFNVLEGNLGVHTTRLTSMLKSDMKPATFWTSSPENFWRHNVAAGCINDGYWLELPGSPGGPSYSPTICPVHGHLGEFFNNTAHSNGVHGLRVYPVYLPRLRPCDPSSGPAPQQFRNFTSFHNGDNGVFGKENGDLHYINAKLVENRGSDMSWVKLKEVNFASSSNPHIQNCLFVATPDPVNRPFNGGKFGLWSPQNEFFNIDGAKFVNYGDHGALAGCNDCTADDSLKQGGYTIRTKRLQFPGTFRKIKHTKPFKEIWYDLDGSLTGVLNGSVTYDRAFNHWSECTVDTTGALDNGLWCDASVRIRRMQFDAVLPKEMDWLYMSFQQRDGLGQISAMPNAAVPGSAAIPFLPKEIYGWVAPMVTSHYYNFNWLTRMDMRTLRIRYSEPDYVRALSVPGTSNTEFLGLSTNYTDFRYGFTVVSSDNRLRPWKSSPIASTDDTGVSVMGELIGANGTWSTIVGAKNSSLYTVGVADPLVLNIKALQCPLSGCPLPPPPELGELARWSNPQAWPGGVVPAPGSDVTISNTMNILYDLPGVSTWGRLTVEGALTFEDGSDMSLSATSIVVFGSLNAGTSLLPRQSRLTFTIRGQRNSPTVVVSNALYLGNKVFAIFGQVGLFGVPRAITSTSLAATLAVGSSTLTLTAAADWKVGDEIVVTPTEYDSSQAETFTITAVSGSTLTLNRAATFQHFAGVIDTAATSNPLGRASVRLAASVGLLSRTITVTSDLTGDAVYGATMVVAEIPSDPAGSASPFIGTFEASFVDFRSMGKQSMEYAAVAFVYGVSNPATSAGTVFAVNPNAVLNRVTGCAFSYGLNYGVEAIGAPNLVLTRNVMYRNYRSAVMIDEYSPGAIISDNLIVQTRRSPDTTLVWVNPFAGIYVNARVAAMQGNVIGGSEDAGIVFMPEACGATPTISNNEVHSTKVGVFLLSNGRSGCVQASGFVSWKAAHLALTTVDQTNVVELKSVVVSDSHIGISLNFFGGNANSKATISDAVILGSTAASSDCSQSSVCQAMTANDVWGANCGSVYGAGTRRVGLMTSLYTNRGKTCFIDGLNGGGLPTCRPPTTPERLCSLPWEKRYGLPNNGAFGRLIVTRTTFAYFAATDCGQRSRAFSFNPTSRDFVPPMHFSAIGWGPQIEEAAKFDVAYREGITEPECANGCDGMNEFVIHDADGTTLGTSLAPASGGAPASIGHSLLSRNVLLAKPGTACVERAEWGMITCLDTVYRQLIVENMDFDRGGRLVGPLSSTRFDATENRTDLSWGPTSDHCPMRFFFGQYQSQVIPFNTYGLEFAGSNPTITRLSFRSTDPDEIVLVSFFYTQPLVLDVLINGQKVPTTNLVTPTLAATTVAGASQFSAQERRIIMALRGSPDPALNVYSIVQKPLVQVTLALAISISEFLGPTLIDNMALLLQIDPSRIRIVRVTPGSTVVEIQIGDYAPTSADTIETAAQISRLQSLTVNLQTIAAEGRLSKATIGYDIIRGDIVGPLSLNGTEGSQTRAPLVTAPEASSGSSFPMWAVGLIIVLAVLAFAGALALFLLVRSRSAQATAQRFIVASSGVEMQPKVSKKDIVTGFDDAPVARVDVAPRTPSQGRLFEEDPVPVVVLHAEPEDAISSPSAKDAAAVGAMGTATDWASQPSNNSRGSSGLSAVHEMDSQDRGESQWKSVASSRVSGGDSHRMGANELPEGHYNVIRSYAPKFADELELAVGETVIVLDGSSSAWFIGYNVRTGKRGSFPKNVVSRDSRITKPGTVEAAQQRGDAGSKRASGSAMFPSSVLQQNNSAHSSGIPSPIHSGLGVSGVSAEPAAATQALVTHSRIDSADDILVTQEHGREGVPQFERLGRVSEGSDAEAAVPGSSAAPVPGSGSPSRAPTHALKHKHSGMDRQQTRK